MAQPTPTLYALDPELPVLLRPDGRLGVTDEPTAVLLAA